MAQQMIARKSFLLYDPSGSTLSTVQLKKAYKGAGGYGIAGDGGDGDPGDAVTVDLSRGNVSQIDSDYYNWYGDIETSYTYTLYVDGSASTSFICEMCFGLDLMQYIQSNRTHAVGDGSDHSDVALNSAHRQTITGNPHSIVKSDVGLGSAENKSATTILGELTISQILASGIDTDDFTDSEGLFITGDDVVESLASASSNANKVVTALAGLIVGNSRMAAQISANANTILTGTASPSGSVSAEFIGQLFVDTSNSKVYIAKATGTAGWLVMN